MRRGEAAPPPGAVLAAATTLDFVEDLREQGRCVLFSTHILSEVERLCDRIAILHDGRVCAVGTLGILVPPSIMLVLMADRLAMSVGDLFLGALFPGLLLAGLYFAWILLYARFRPGAAPAAVIRIARGCSRIPNSTACRPTCRGSPRTG